MSAVGCSKTITTCCNRPRVATRERPLSGAPIAAPHDRSWPIVALCVRPLYTVNMGSLPFRVWQIFDKLVEYRKAGKQNEFLCAAAILAHYVGDACQPLHGSMHSDGLCGASTGVHSQYEEKIIDRFALEIEARLDAFDLSKLAAMKTTQVKNGYQAGQASVELIRRAQSYLAPERICKTYTSDGGGSGQAMLSKMWAALGDDTIRCLPDGYRTLAFRWDAAYKTGSRKDFSGSVTTTALRKIYEGKDFLPSNTWPIGKPPIFRCLRGIDDTEVNEPGRKTI